MWQDTSVAAVCILMSVFATLYRLCVCRFEEMNVTKSLRDNLTGRMIIEHPTVHICTVQNHSWETSFTTPIHLLLYLLITLIRHNERHVYANVECEDILAGRQVIVWAVLNSTLVILHMCAKISVMIQLRADSKICKFGTVLMFSFTFHVSGILRKTFSRPSCYQNTDSCEKNTGCNLGYLCCLMCSKHMARLTTKLLPLLKVLLNVP